MGSKLRGRLKIATNNEVLMAAEIALAKMGAATSMSAIAKEAGVAVGTLYNYFSDKEKLIEHILKMRRAELVAGMKTEAEASVGRSFVQRLNGIVSAEYRFFMERQTYLRIIFSSDIPIRGKGSQIAQQMREAVLPIVEQGIAEGVLKKQESVLYVSLILGAVRAICLHRLESGEFKPEMDIPFLIETFLNGALQSGEVTRGN